MFDVGFSEMIVIGIVALVVIGPERLPKVARTVGHLIGRAQRYVNDVKRDIDREVQIDELRKLQTQMQDAAREIETSVSTSVAEVKQELDKTEGELTAVADELSSNEQTPSLDVATEVATDVATEVAANATPDADATPAIATAPTLTSVSAAAESSKATAAAAPTQSTQV